MRQTAFAKLKLFQMLFLGDSWTDLKHVETCLSLNPGDSVPVQIVPHLFFEMNAMLECMNIRNFLPQKIFQLQDNFFYQWMSIYSIFISHFELSEVYFTFDWSFLHLFKGQWTLYALLSTICHGKFSLKLHSSQFDRFFSTSQKSLDTSKRLQKYQFVIAHRILTIAEIGIAIEIFPLNFFWTHKYVMNGGGQHTWYGNRKICLNFISAQFQCNCYSCLVIRVRWNSCWSTIS